MNKRMWNSLIWIAIIVCVTTALLVESHQDNQYRIAKLNCEVKQ